MRNFKELKVWKAGIEVTKLIFQITKSFTSQEKYGLTSQMTRSAFLFHLISLKDAEEELTRIFISFSISLWDLRLN